MSNNDKFSKCYASEAEKLKAEAIANVGEADAGSIDTDSEGQMVTLSCIQGMIDEDES